MKNLTFFLLSALFMLVLGLVMSLMAQPNNIVALRLGATMLFLGIMFLFGAVNCLKQDAINNKI